MILVANWGHLVWIGKNNKIKITNNDDKWTSPTKQQAVILKTINLTNLTNCVSPVIDPWGASQYNNKLKRKRGQN